MIHGSFWVIHQVTRSASRSATACAYAVKAFTEERSAHVRLDGMSQWLSVSTGSTPASSSASVKRS